MKYYLTFSCDWQERVNFKRLRGNCRWILFESPGFCIKWSPVRHVWGKQSDRHIANVGSNFPNAVDNATPILCLFLVFLIKMLFHVRGHSTKSWMFLKGLFCAFNCVIFHLFRHFHLLRNPSYNFNVFVGGLNLKNFTKIISMDYWIRCTYNVFATTPSRLEFGSV